MKTKAFAVVLALFALSILAPAAQATVLRVVVVQTDNLENYAKEIEKGQALIKAKGGTALLRVWRARFAGSEAGTIVVSVEYPDLEAYVANEKKLNSDAEYQAWFKGLAKIRKVVSDSLYDEVKASM